MSISFFLLSVFIKEVERERWVHLALWKSQICLSSDSFLIQMGVRVLHHSINFHLQNESQAPLGFEKKEVESQT